jgi:hypothetical protein
MLTPNKTIHNLRPSMYLLIKIKMLSNTVHFLDVVTFVIKLKVSVGDFVLT